MKTVLSSISKFSLREERLLRETKGPEHVQPAELPQGETKEALSTNTSGNEVQNVVTGLMEKAGLVANEQLRKVGAFAEKMESAFMKKEEPLVQGPKIVADSVRLAASKNSEKGLGEVLSERSSQKVAGTENPEGVVKSKTVDLMKDPGVRALVSEWKACPEKSEERETKEGMLMLRYGVNVEKSDLEKEQLVPSEGAAERFGLMFSGLLKILKSFIARFQKKATKIPEQKISAEDPNEMIEEERTEEVESNTTEMEDLKTKEKSVKEQLKQLKEAEPPTDPEARLKFDAELKKLTEDFKKIEEEIKKLEERNAALSKEVPKDENPKGISPVKLPDRIIEKNISGPLIDLLSVLPIPLPGESKEERK